MLHDTNSAGRAIKRIIFESVSKFNGIRHELIEAPHLKQIAGRAGRYRTSAQAEGPQSNLDESTLNSKKNGLQLPSPNLGLVTTMEEADLPILRKAMDSKLHPIMSAGIFPPIAVLLKFAIYFPPSTSFSYILLRLHELSLKHPRYHLCVLKDQVAIADTIQPIKNLTTHDRIIFCAAPASVKNHGIGPIVTAFAKCVGDRSSGALLEIKELPLEILDQEMTPDRAYMERLELLHKALILYLWLSYRFAGVFINQTMAFYVKRLTEDKIDKMLAEYSASPEIRKRIQRMREEALLHVSKLNEPNTELGNSETHAQTSDARFVPRIPRLVEQNQGPVENQTDLIFKRYQESSNEVL